VKIQDPNRLETVMFHNIKAGSTFRHGVDIYIKTQEGPPDSYNAVCLNDGSVARLREEVKVVQVETELTIK